ncbi:hypothetical protein Esti_001752 [Eimeria stiedai]
MEICSGSRSHESSRPGRSDSGSPYAGSPSSTYATEYRLTRSGFEALEDLYCYGGPGADAAIMGLMPFINRRSPLFHESYSAGRDPGFSRVVVSSVPTGRQGPYEVLRLKADSEVLKVELDVQRCNRAANASSRWENAPYIELRDSVSPQLSPRPNSSSSSSSSSSRTLMLTWPRGPASLPPLLLGLVLLLLPLQVHGGSGEADSLLRFGNYVGSSHAKDRRREKHSGLRGPLLESTDDSSLGGLLAPVDGEAGGIEAQSRRPGALKRFSNRILNSSLVDKLVSVVRYFVGPIPGRPDKALLRQSNSVGIGVGVVVHLLRGRNPEEVAALSEHIKEAPGVRQFIQRFGESADPTRSIRTSLQQLLWVRRSCARLALSSYGGRQQAEFLSLLNVFRQEYIHLLGFVARCLDDLPGSLPALNLFVERLLVPLQDALRSLSSVSGRFPGFRLTLAQQQLLRWVGHLARLDAALMPLVPGGLQTLSDFQAFTSMDSSLEETDSRHNSQDGDDLLAGYLDSHL